jgi:hypothetical protein
MASTATVSDVHDRGMAVLSLGRIRSLRMLAVLTLAPVLCPPSNLGRTKHATVPNQTRSEQRTCAAGDKSVTSAFMMRNP